MKTHEWLLKNNKLDWKQRFKTRKCLENNKKSGHNKITNILSDKRGRILRVWCVKAFAKTVSTEDNFEVWLNAIDDVNSTETKDDKGGEH